MQAKLKTNHTPISSQNHSDQENNDENVDYSQYTEMTVMSQ